MPRFCGHAKSVALTSRVVGIKGNEAFAYEPAGSQSARPATQVSLSKQSGVSLETFCHNGITTSQYTALNFVPKNLYEQLTKISNAYFLFILVLQSIPMISVTNGLPTIALPLSFVVCVNAIKDALEDRKRHKNDDIENDQEVCLLQSILSKQSETATTTAIRNIKGDYVQLKLHTSTKSERNLARQESAREDRKLLDADAIANTHPERPMAVLETIGSKFESVEFFDSPTRASQSALSASIELKKDLRRKQWKELEVGDLIVIFANQVMPADCLLLASGEQRANVFVETSSLDGETSLKVKTALPVLQELLWVEHSSPQVRDELIFLQAAGLNMNVACAPPNASLSNFTGNVHLGRGRFPLERWCKITASQDDLLVLPVNADQLLLRGCRICHTAWAVALVVYTGQETKIRLNSNPARRKISKVEKKTHKLVIGIFIIVACLCIVAGSMTAVIAASERYKSYRYLNFVPFETGRVLDDLGVQGRTRLGLIGLTSFFTWIVLFTNFVPISLVVSMGLVKAAQAWHMGLDRSMCDMETKQYAVVRSSDLNEELGQVSYLMTDKTGTLTANVMEFRKMAIGGSVYGDGMTAMRRKLLMQAGKSPAPPPMSGNLGPKTPHVDCVSPSLLRRLRGDPETRRDALLFLLNLAVNHSILVDDSAASAKGLVYIASSPDEEALVYAARHFDVKFEGRQKGDLNLRILGRDYTVTILSYWPFSSERRRSTALVRLDEELARLISGQSYDSARIFVFVKGADSVVPMLCDLDSETGREKLEEANIHIDDFARDCLRTLCLAYKIISNHDLGVWLDAYTEANQAMVDRDELILETASLVEGNLIFQGVTGIEDQLSDGVPETISDLLKAGIRVWMLTGDKFETAFNIGLATCLVPPKSQHIYIVPDRIFGDRTPEDDQSKIEYLREIMPLILRTVRNDTTPVSPPSTAGHAGILRRMISARVSGLGESNAPTQASPTSSKLVSFWDGDILRLFLEDDGLRRLCFELCQICYSVVFCRVTPQEKGGVVRMVREFHPGAVTLAIGDGANDCNMIQCANVGVGIKGKEGLQAFSASDYGLGQFRFLRPLLLVHGRWNYRRMSKMVLHTFYKNFVFVMPTFYLAILSLFTGQKAFSEVINQTYNVLLTALPLIAFGIWDQDVDRELSLKFPQMYRVGILDAHLSKKVMLEWLFFSLWHSIVAFFLPLLSLTGASITSKDNIPNDFSTVSNTIFLQVMIIVNLKIVLETMCPNWMTLVTVAASFAMHFFILYFLSMWPQRFPDTTGVIGRILNTPLIWLLTIAVTIISLSLDISVHIFNRSFKPELHHLMQFLMRFEQEEIRARRALMLEAIKQGGPQLLNALGVPERTKRTKLASIKSRIRRRDRQSPDASLDLATMPENVVSSREYSGEEETELEVRTEDDRIQNALDMHNKYAARRVLGPTTAVSVVLEMLHIKPIFEKMRGGFAFTAADYSAVPLAFSSRIPPLDLPSREEQSQWETARLTSREGVSQGSVIED